MDIKALLMVVLLVVVLWSCGSNGGTYTQTEMVQSQSDCVAAIKAQYADQWSAMNQMQRAAVGLQAASCGEVR